MGEFCMALTNASLQMHEEKGFWTVSTQSKRQVAVLLPSGGKSTWGLHKSRAVLLGTRLSLKAARTAKKLLIKA